jgi:diguanylate cyclase (GGDEF)-like protein/PAS domain S-box-containing protein
VIEAYIFNLLDNVIIKKSAAVKIVYVLSQIIHTMLSTKGDLSVKYNYQDLLEHMHDGVYFVNKERKIIYWNKAAEIITGYTFHEVVDKCCYDNILNHVDDRGTNLCQNLCPLAQTIEDGANREAEVYLLHKRGHRVPVWVRATLLRNSEGKIVGAAEMFTDVSPKLILKQRLKELEEMALIDELTQLSNRRHTEMEIESRIQEMRRYNLSFGILFMDVDNFKHVNDFFGHDIGDRVLKMIADTLKTTARPFDLFGRWGGEEFIGIIRNVSLCNLVSVGNRYRALIEKSYIHMRETFITVTVSMGAALVRKDDTSDSLIKRADGLMYESKQRGRNCLTIEF